jgi:eukaryotic-like serine/threonine-protein kinase
VIAVDPLTDADPRMLGSITLKGRLGAGGMGQVYLGVTEDGDKVAVKRIQLGKDDQPQWLARFAREAEAMAMVQGNGAAMLLDHSTGEHSADAHSAHAHSSEDDEAPWLAMEYVPGLDLRTFVKRDGPLDATDATALALLLAEALEEIHSAGLLHRDLKPANVMLGPRGPQVIDFGLVAIGEPGGEHTATNMVLGTLPCMAPEQAQSAKQATAQSDVYALGATVLYAATGHYPYRDPTVFVVASPTHSPDLDGAPEELRPLLASLLAHAPEQRPQLPELRARLTQHVAASGLSPSAARDRLAQRTYVPGADDDSLPTAASSTSPVTRRSRTVPATGQHLPGLGAAAARLRTAYARARSW